VRRIAVAAAVSERIGGDVEDAHDERALAEGERTSVRKRNRVAPAEQPYHPAAEVPLHSTGDASRRSALLVG
jgi:hypothetical protein